jgi:hypothetical protein
VAGIQEALQNQHCGHLIDDVAASGSRCTACGIQVPVGLGGAHAFIPQMNRELRSFVQLCGKGARGLGAGAVVPGEMQWQANNNLGHLMAARQARQGAQVGPCLCAVQRQQRLRGQAQCIRERNANAAFAVVQAKDAAQSGRSLHKADLIWKRGDARLEDVAMRAQTLPGWKGGRERLQ